MLSGQLGLEWKAWKVKNKEIGFLAGKKADTLESTGTGQVLIPLQEFVPLPVSVHFSIVSLTDFTQKVALFDLESTTRYSANFYMQESWNWWLFVIYFSVLVNKNAGRKIMYYLLQPECDISIFFIYFCLVNEIPFLNKSIFLAHLFVSDQFVTLINLLT